MNLNDALSSTQPGSRRAFYPPLCCIPLSANMALDWSATRAVSRDAFDAFSEGNVSTQVNGITTTTDVWLDIFVRPPAAGQTENALPAPAIRLHAVDRGYLFFRRRSASQPADWLLLYLLSFNLPLAQPAWFARWSEANCIPATLRYENVDAHDFETLVANLPLPTNSMQGHYFGLAFPASVTQATQATYIQDVLAGTQPLLVDAGACIGAIAKAPSGTNDERYRLRLSARYAAADPGQMQPMNPRELFHLLFGDDSVEATAHPLFMGMSAFALTQANQPESRTMRLRPPLRTWHRVAWEAQREIDLHHDNWKPGSKLGPARFYNTRQAGFDPGDYFIAGKDVNKCNLFASDICLRAGFRIATHLVNKPNNIWHYVNASTYTNSAQAASELDTTSDRVELIGLGETPGRTWGWGMDNWLRSTLHQSSGATSDLQAQLNSAMQQEGRCFILAGARKPGHSGHIIIVKAFTGQPQPANTSEADPNDAGHKKRGLQQLAISTLEASSGGALSRSIVFKLQGTAGSASSAFGFQRIQLIELQPGMDPDTLQGLADLNVRHHHGDPIERCRSALKKRKPATNVKRIAKLSSTERRRQRPSAHPTPVSAQVKPAKSVKAQRAHTKHKVTHG